MSDLPVELGAMDSIPPAFRYRVKDMLRLVPREGNTLDGVALERVRRLIEEGEPWLGADPSLADIGMWMVEAGRPVELRRRGCTWLTLFPTVETVKRLAAKAGIATPEVAVYEGEPNAFATGAFKNSALVAVSSGLLNSMSRDEVEAVLGHEIGHVANGDMVTLTLIQGVVNTFVIFLSRLIGYVVDRMILKNERGQGIGYFVTVIASQILLGFLASMIVAWFSRQREFRADAASASLLGSPQPMVHALARLGGLQPGQLPEAMKASGISAGPGGFGALFSTHPPVEERIAALQSRSAGATSQ